MLAGMFYNELESDLSNYRTALLRPQSIGYVCFRCPRKAEFDDVSRAFQSPIIHHTYKDVPFAYLLTEKDQSFRHEYQVKTVQHAGITVMQ